MMPHPAPRVLDADNTHGPAAQASSGLLLLRLRQDLTSSTEEGVIDEPNCKRYIEQCQAAMEQGEDCPVYVGDRTGIEGILRLIRHIFTNMPHRSQHDKAMVLKEMACQVGLGRDHFTRNTVFIDGEERVVDSALGETLNLVALALCQDNLEETETDRNLRIETLFNALLTLQVIAKCTAGRQHDVLYVLNGVYQIKTPDGETAFWMMIEDQQDFLFQTLSEYIGERLDAERFGMDIVLSWIESEVNPDIDMPASITRALDDIHLEEVMAHLRSKASTFGLNPSDAVLTAIHHAIQSINVPDGPLDEGLVPLLRGFFALKKTGHPARDERIQALREDLRPLNMLKIIQLKRLMEAEAYFQRYLHYQPFLLSFNDGDAAFIKARDELMNALSARYSDPLNLDLDAEFERTKQLFLEEEKRLQASHPIEFIRNFFAIFQHAPEQRAALLAQLQTHKEVFQTDERVLVAFIQEAEDAERKGEVLYVTPYQINYLLLSALLHIQQTPEVELRQTFILRQIIKFLMQPRDTVLRFVDGEFIKNYGKNFLLSLEFFLDCPVELRPLISQGAFSQKALSVADDEPLFYQMFSLPIEVFSAAQHIQLWELVGDKIIASIQDSTALLRILWLSDEQFPLESRLAYLSKVDFQALINNYLEFSCILRLSDEQFPRESRLACLSKIDFGTVIKDGWQLWRLLSVSDAQFPRESRLACLSKIDFGAVIKDDSLLLALLRLSDKQFPRESRLACLPQIDFGTVIKDGGPLLELLRLSDEQFPREARLACLSKIDFGTVIKNGGPLLELLRLSDAQFPREARLACLSQIDFGTVIKHGWQLLESLRLSDAQFPREARLACLSKIDFGTVIKNDRQVLMLLILPDKQFPREVRLACLPQIDFGAFIKHDWLLLELLRLSDEQFPRESRLACLSKIDFGTVIKNDRQVLMLLILPDKQFPREVRLACLSKIDFMVVSPFELSEIVLYLSSDKQLSSETGRTSWALVKSKLSAFINNHPNKKTISACLFNRTYSEFPLEQREKIRTIIQPPVLDRFLLYCLSDGSLNSHYGKKEIRSFAIRQLVRFGVASLVFAVCFSVLFLGHVALIGMGVLAEALLISACTGVVAFALSWMAQSISTRRSTSTASEPKEMEEISESARLRSSGTDSRPPLPPHQGSGVFTVPDEPREKATRSHRVHPSHNI